MGKIFISILIVLVFVGGFWFLSRGGREEVVNGDPADNLVLKTDPLNTTYQVEGAFISLVNGRAETEEAPGSVTKIETKVFGEPVYGDMDKDGDEDAGVFLVQEPGGTGSFYYVAAAMNESGTYKGTNAIFLGDRIAPDTLSIGGGGVIANYMDRKPDEPFSSQPSVGKTKYTFLKNGTLSEVEIRSGSNQN